VVISGERLFTIATADPVAHTRRKSGDDRSHNQSDTTGGKRGQPGVDDLFFKRHMLQNSENCAIECGARKIANSISLRGQPELDDLILTGKSVSRSPFFGSVPLPSIVPAGRKSER
jgi:hypothetical protein